MFPQKKNNNYTRKGARYSLTPLCTLHQNLYSLAQPPPQSKVSANICYCLELQPVFSTARTLQSCRLPEGGSAADCRRAGVLHGNTGSWRNPRHRQRANIQSTLQEPATAVLCSASSRRAKLYVARLSQSRALHFHDLPEQFSTI